MHDERDEQSRLRNIQLHRGLPARLYGRRPGPPAPGTQPTLPELQGEFRRHVRLRTALYAERFWTRHLGPERGELMAEVEVESLLGPDLPKNW
jgi:hypothetical protein